MKLLSPFHYPPSRCRIPKRPALRVGFKAWSSQVRLRNLPINAIPTSSPKPHRNSGYPTNSNPSDLCYDAFSLPMKKRAMIVIK